MFVQMYKIPPKCYFKSSLIAPVLGWLKLFVKEKAIQYKYQTKKSQRPKHSELGQ